MSDLESRGAGQGSGELQPLPDQHDSEENWTAFERYLKEKTITTSDL